ncbi:amino acid permease [Rhodopseudomonas palustris]|uniref:Amino acid permease n=1 Tax=Thiospirillum jenense TaxID=1653858 RepID=A0A839H325_9GAMM|nr:amino acid permease [Thiospirillum jenense]MBB1089703.1 amino acid permease [Rhodopseudomonas palustris]MBB1124803.1 amino acid permease [Thiospirillum jenense]
MQLAALLRTKTINADHVHHQGELRRVLGPIDLTLLGIGAIIGAGIFVLTGVAAATQAGPSIILSYAVAGIACTFSALAYAELAAAVGGCGSAYGYSYAGLGELVAWIIGWDLILEYGVATAAVAIGWSSYVNNALSAMGLALPELLTKTPVQGGWINLPAALIVLILAFLLSLGVRESVRVNTIMVVVKLLAITLFIGVALSHIEPANWTPFMPFGWEGVMGGAAVIFFAYIGFDAVSTAAEEARNPQRDLPIGILLSLGICTLIYIIVAGLLTLVVAYPTLNVGSPVADVMLRLGYPWAAGLVATGAIAGLTTVMLVLYYGLTRVFLAMSRDGLLPPVFARVHSKTRTPIRVIMVSGVLMAAIAGFTPISDVAELVNIGTLAAFFLVCIGVVMMRRSHPDLPRPFLSPGAPIVPLLGALSCLFLMVNLSAITWLRFGIWLALGLVIYFAYSRYHSSLATVSE